MKLTLKRIAKRNTYTIGRLYIDNVLFCDVLEDKDRGLKSNMPLSKIQQIKVKHETAIPTGTYKITLDVISPKFSQKQFYRDNANNGRLPRLLNVPGYDGILMHAGSSEKDTSGCLLVGENKVVGKVINSQATFKRLYKKLLTAKDNITIEIL